MQRSRTSNSKPRVSGNPAWHLQFEAIGTVWTLDFYQLATSEQQAKLQDKIHRRINVFDKHYSRFRADSLVSAMAQRAGTYRLPRDAQKLLDLYHDMYEVTDGAVTPLIGQVLVDAGYDASYSLQPGRLQPPPRWEAVLEYDFPNLTLREPALLDFGAAGKGYLVDIIGEMLEKHGVQSFCINAGGDVLYRQRGRAVLEVGLEDPDDPSQVIGVARLANGSLCGSAGNRRAWSGFHHIIDPRSLRSPQHLKAVWVVADSTLLADGLATCLFFVPAQELANLYTFEYAIVHQNGALEQSGQFPADFFVAAGEE